MEINKVQWRMIAKGEKLPCDSFLMKKDGTMTSMVTGAGVTVGQDAYYLPVEELRSFPKEESEDERIRKELIAEVKEKIDCIPVPDCRDKEDEKALKQLNKWLAWLEKQGEQILANSAKTCKDEQKPTEEYNITGIKSKHAQGKLGEMIKRKLEIEKQGEQKPAWSEEDEKFFKTALWHISYSISNGKSTDIHCDTTDWFKNLKDRLQPQRTWKPSDEQMEALKYSTYCPDKQMSKVLFELYQDLKKLREE